MGKRDKGVKTMSGRQSCAGNGPEWANSDDTKNEDHMEFSQERDRIREKRGGESGKEGSKKFKGMMTKVDGKDDNLKIDDECKVILRFEEENGVHSYESSEVDYDIKKPMTVQCIRDGQFVVVVSRDVTLPRLSLDTVHLLGGNDPPCAPVGSTPSFAIYQFPVTACGTSVMEDSGYVVYENRMTSSYEVGIGPYGSITRDSHFEFLFQCRYSGTSVEALVVEVNSVPPPPPVAAPGPLRVELRLANGQCVTKGCAEGDEAYTSYYSDADYPITKVLREPVYVEVHIMERTDPNIVLTLGRCWTTSTPSPLSLPQWDLLIDG
ncbi:zona pellucida sperm-binding protein 4-like [Carassius carassius]|uniref:zona pellucida sperm-binding protein 4-like n=1 Tax=Carassius carassius TaxID=217509 RepID=UPI0028687E77|nr:zona pellucida sperm-binding protein 4-like [Carassius carassius]